MGAAPAIPEGMIPRQAPRHPLAIPVDVSLLRSGVPESIPGRSLNIGEGGMAAIVAGELIPGDTIGVEFRLPSVGGPLRAKAVVRHHAHLRCGVEFIGLSAEQRAMIRYWNRRNLEVQLEQGLAVFKPPETAEEKATSLPPPAWGDKGWADKGWSDKLRRILAPRILWTALAVFLLIGLIGWWRWYQAWDELESHLPKKAAATGPATKVPPEIIQQLVTHKVEPVYPNAAQKAKVEGTVLVDTTISPDGSVVEAKAVSGPELLAPAAARAVRWWRFRPYQIDGKPAEVHTTLAVEFHVPR